MSQVHVSLDAVRHVAACKTAFYDVSAPWSLSLRHFDTSVRRRLDASRRHVKKARHLGSTCRREASSTLPTHVSRCRSDASAMWRLGFTKFDTAARWFDTSDAPRHRVGATRSTRPTRADV